VLGQKLASDGELLAEHERAAIANALAQVEAVVPGDDPAAIRSAIEALNRATEDFAGRRMDRSVKQALTGKRVDTLA
jgi:molecular chaperone HscA